MVFEKDWFTISKLIFHFLEYYKLNYGTTDVDRIKINIRTMVSNDIDLGGIEITKNNITKALSILGIKKCKGINALINNTYPIYFDHQKYLEKFHGLSGMRFAVMGGFESV